MNTPHVFASFQEDFFSHLTTLIQGIDTPSIVLAVSGGSDSMALLHLMHTFQITYAPHLFLAVATVDHGIRMESLNEAKHVARVCHNLGLPHSILRWEGEKPKTRLQERAREARYTLLHDFCRKHDANILMTAHHYDDQIETFFMRLFKGSSPFGLLGIKPKDILSHYPFIKKSNAHQDIKPLYIIRPLLDFSKNQLIDYLHTQNVSFKSDSSNANETFTRVKWRNLLQKMKEMDFDMSILKKTFMHMEEEQNFLLKTVQSAHSQCLQKGNLPSHWFFDVTYFLNLDPFLQKRVLRRMIAQLSKKKYPPKFSQILLYIEKIKKNESFTCSGYHWKFQKQPHIYALEEERSQKP